MQNDCGEQCPRMQQRHREHPAGKENVEETRLQAGSSFVLKLVREGGSIFQTEQGHNNSTVSLVTVILLSSLNFLTTL